MVMGQNLRPRLSQTCRKFREGSGELLCDGLINSLRLLLAEEYLGNIGHLALTVFGTHTLYVNVATVMPGTEKH